MKIKMVSRSRDTPDASALLSTPTTDPTYPRSGHGATRSLLPSIMHQHIAYRTAPIEQNAVATALTNERCMRTKGRRSVTTISQVLNKV